MEGEGFFRNAKVESSKVDDAILDARVLINQLEVSKC
jgi:hypothetical protein